MTLQDWFETRKEQQHAARPVDVKIDDTSYDAYQLGIYNVEVTATDMFSNLSTKVVQVEVVDKTAEIRSEQA